MVMSGCAVFPGSTVVPIAGVLFLRVPGAVFGIFCVGVMLSRLLRIQVQYLLFGVPSYAETPATCLLDWLWRGQAVQLSMVPRLGC